jgi:hypothetical protein
VLPGASAPEERVVSLAARRQRPRGTARPPWVTRLTSDAGLRAAAALLLAAVGGAVVATRRQESVPPIAPQGAGIAGGIAGGMASDTAGHALGDRFPDLSEDELSAVLVALEDDDAALPALEPAMLAPEYRGGGE